MKTGAHLTEFIDQSNDLENLTIPIAILKFNSRELYNSYQVLETQLSKIDPMDKPLVYDALNTLTQHIFDSWVFLGTLTNWGERYGLPG